MILHCNYEELTALRTGAHALLEEAQSTGGTVAAPPVETERVQLLLPKLDGDLVVTTLHEQRTVVSAVEVIVSHLHREMETRITSWHPAHEESVAAYFDYAHAYAVLSRLREVGEEMEALIEVVTGSRPTRRTARSFVFPD